MKWIVPIILMITCCGLGAALFASQREVARLRSETKSLNESFRAALADLDKSERETAEWQHLTISARR